MGKENPSLTAITLDDLVAEFGRMIPEAVLAEYFGIGVRTMRKYADRWGGVEIIPGRFAFFESQIRKVIENAKPMKGTRETALARGQCARRSLQRKMIPRRQEGQGTGGQGRRPDDPFGLLDGYNPHD